MSTRGTGNLCATIAAGDVDSMVRMARSALAEGVDLVEFRLDYIKEAPVKELVEKLSPFSNSSVITLRSRAEGGRFRGTERKRLGRLVEVSRAQPRYIDFELVSAEKERAIARELRRNCDELIISWHNFSITPERSRLLRIRERARRLGDIAKVVATARSVKDNAKILSLYENGGGNHLIAFCMGRKGVASRILCLLGGSPLSYVSMHGGQVAPGQLQFHFMKEVIGTVAE